MPDITINVSDEVLKALVEKEMEAISSDAIAELTYKAAESWLTNPDNVARIFFQDPPRYSSNFSKVPTKILENLVDKAIPPERISAIISKMIDQIYMDHRSLLVDAMARAIAANLATSDLRNGIGNALLTMAHTYAPPECEAAKVEGERLINPGDTMAADRR